MGANRIFNDRDRKGLGPMPPMPTMPARCRETCEFQIISIVVEAQGALTSYSLIGKE